VPDPEIKEKVACFQVAKECDLLFRFLDSVNDAILACLLYR
jgi:hypothetical protein